MLESSEFEAELDVLMGELRDAVIQAVATGRSPNQILHSAGLINFYKSMDNVDRFVEDNI